MGTCAGLPPMSVMDADADAVPTHPPHTATPPAAEAQSRVSLRRCPQVQLNAAAICLASNRRHSTTPQWPHRTIACVPHAGATSPPTSVTGRSFGASFSTTTKYASIATRRRRDGGYLRRCDHRTSRSCSSSQQSRREDTSRRLAAEPGEVALRTCHDTAAVPNRAVPFGYSLCAPCPADPPQTRGSSWVAIASVACGVCVQG